MIVEVYELDKWSAVQFVVTDTIIRTSSPRRPTDYLVLRSYPRGPRW